jgi:hypothetical protein
VAIRHAAIDGIGPGGPPAWLRTPWAISSSPLRRLTVVSRSPWKTMMGTPPAGAWRFGLGMAPPFMAASADGKSCAEAKGKPECTPTAANSSGYRVPTMTAMAPPADRPATNTSRSLTGYSSMTCWAMPAISDGSPGRAAGRWH